MFGVRRDLSEYLQSEESECGLMCLAAATAVLGGAITASTTRSNFNTSVRGASAARLCEIAVGLNLLASPVACEKDEVGALKLPAIAHWNGRHFVLVIAVLKRGVRIFDPAQGERTVRRDEWQRCFSGAAIQLEAAYNFRKTGPRTRTRFGPLIAVLADTRGRILQLLALSLILQIVALVVPLLSQLTINLGAMEGNVQAVGAISGCILLVYVANFFVEAWRFTINQRIASHISSFTARNMFRHLLAMPMPWFERRRIADISTRFDSIDPLRSALTSGLATLLIDGSLSLVLALVLLFVSPLLATIVIVSVIFVGICKLAFSPLISRAAAESAGHRIAENAKRWETFRNVQSLKLAGAEISQERVWEASFTSSIVALEKSQSAASMQQATTNLLGAIGSLFMIYVGAIMIGAGQLSVGALFAFVMYRRYLADKVSAALDQINALWMLKFHLQRVSEVFEAETEPRWNDMRSSGDYVSEGSIELRELFFRHAINDPFVLTAVNLKINSGELIMIVGPSGQGKSTLLRLLAGLYQPSGGEILIDDVPLASMSPRALRQSLAAVMQEDELLSGTIFDNITMFDQQPDIERTIDALKAAEAWDQVRTLPLGIHTPVGEGGRMLSAGQRQRLLIARALYKRPRILLLDEATSNVDPVAERMIFEQLRQLKSTKIVISHHAGLQHYADRLYVLDQNGLRLQARPTEEAAA